MLSVISLVAGLAGCSSSPAPASAPSMAAVRALLARHGAAVRADSRSAFLADVDPASAAAGFRRRQAAEFANLVRLPLATWSYTAEARTDDRESEASATKKFGAPAIIVRIALHYALAGIDTVPTEHELWWTFVKQGGRVVVAADNGLAGAGGQSWQGPWDFGPLEAVSGRASLVLGHSSDHTSLTELAATVDAAIPAVTAVWGTDWARRVAVVVPSSAAELAAQTGGLTSAITTDVAAAAISDGSDPLTGAVLGQRLIVNPAALARLSAVGRQIVLRHEITHIASAPATTDNSPRWLVEGFAEYVGNLGSGQPVPTAAAELRSGLRHGEHLASLPDENAFDSAQAAQAYQGAWLACRLLAARLGRAGLVRFYKQVGADAGGPDAALAAALRADLHETTARFSAQWRSYVTAELAA